MRLNLQSAASHIGVPKHLLASWVWAGGGPTPVGGKRYAAERLEFETEELDRWLKANVSIGRALDTVPIVYPEPQKPYERQPLRIRKTI